MDIDLNKDFYLSEDEQHYFFSKNSYKDTTNRYDKNGDGKVSPQENDSRFSVDLMRKACNGF